ncbi:MAG TPA: ArsB/NhaD family transporter [Candidatus Gastranaerophilales bacterium]|nr:ArsB/NhaD family transporter [Candidatus Gastranaerophilales bacterium]
MFEHSSTILGLDKVIVAGIILFIAYVFIAIEKLPKATVAMLGAAITLVLGIVPAEHAFSHVDFGVIVLLISMMIIVHIAGRSGVFTWVAFELLKYTKGKPLNILVALAVFTAIASAFLDNVTTVILIMPVTFVIARELKVDPIPFLITEILASNIGGTATLIGDPPNIIIGSAAGLSFNDFIVELTPIIIIIFIVCLAVIAYMFRNDLETTPERMQYVANIDNSGTIKDKELMIRSMIVLGLVILGFILHDALKLEAYTIALLGASVLLIFEAPKQVLQDVEWLTIFFFIGLFIIIGGLVETGGIEFLAGKLLDLTKGDPVYTSMLIIWASGILSAIVDNIPYTVTMVPLIQELHASMDIYPLWWSLSLGACLGGNATIIGAAANVIVSESAYAAGHPISFLRFMKYGAFITFISLILSSIYVYFKYLV